MLVILMGGWGVGGLGGRYSDKSLTPTFYVIRFTDPYLPICYQLAIDPVLSQVYGESTESPSLERLNYHAKFHRA